MRSTMTASSGLSTAVIDTRNATRNVATGNGTRSFSLERGLDAKMQHNVAVVGNGYWGKNLVRNFFELGALHTVCDGNPLVEANVPGEVPRS